MNIKILMGMSSYFLSTLPDFMLVCDVAITSDKGSLISRYTGYITSKIWIKTTDCNLFRAIRRLYALHGTPFFGSAHCMPPAVLRRAGPG